MADDSHRLVIVRHAKSAWPDGVPDEKRPLNKRGRRDAPAVGRWLRKRIGRPRTVVCSPAARTRQTWELAADELGKAPDPVFDKRVYEASAKKLLAVVRDLPDGAGPAVLVGHNPGVADLVELLTGESPEMKTSAIAVLDVAGSWADLGPGGAELVAYATPRG
jgi:phosphohistidine phosphatase